MSRSPNTIVGSTTRAQRLLTLAPYAAFLLIAWFLLFHNLDGHLLWGDEAETAVLGRNVAKYGVPKTVDGVNQITLYGAGIDSNQQHIWTWSPWLQLYVAAGAFTLFGPTTWAARAPFAFIAWLSLPLLAWVVHRIYRDHRVALASLVLVGTSEILLLHARQCRYYSISILAEILFVYAIYRLSTRDWKGGVTLAVALTVMFYSNYIIALANLPVLVPLAWSLWRQHRRSFVALAAGAAGFLLVATPWLFYAQVWRQSQAIGHDDALVKAWYYIREFHFHFVPLIFLALPLLRRFGRSTAADAGLGPLPRFERYLLVLLPSYLAIIVIAPGSYLRYLLPLLPVACILTSAWLFRSMRGWLAIVVVLIQCLSSAPAVATGFPFRDRHALRWPLFEYVANISRPYSDRFAEVLTILDREARPGQTVFVFDPEFPLMFYTRLKILDGRLVKGRVDQPPDWILSESASGVVRQSPIELPEVYRNRYEPVVLEVPDSPRDGGIPEPDLYQYRTASGRVPFVLYRRKDGPD